MATGKVERNKTRVLTGEQCYIWFSGGNSPFQYTGVRIYRLGQVLNIYITCNPDPRVPGLPQARTHRRLGFSSLSV